MVNTCIGNCPDDQHLSRITREQNIRCCCWILRSFWDRQWFQQCMYSVCAFVPFTYCTITYHHSMTPKQKEGTRVIACKKTDHYIPRKSTAEATKCSARLPSQDCSPCSQVLQPNVMLKVRTRGFVFSRQPVKWPLTGVLNWYLQFLPDDPMHEYSEISHYIF